MRRGGLRRGEARRQDERDGPDTDNGGSREAASRSAHCQIKWSVGKMTKKTGTCIFSDRFIPSNDRKRIVGFGVAPAATFNTSFDLQSNIFPEMARVLFDNAE